MEWDYDDRLVRVVKADGTVVQNVYDMDGVLVRTTVTPAAGAAVTTNYLADTTGGLSHVVAEIRGGNLQKTYVRAGNMLLAELEGMPGGGVRYYEAEGIGSVRSLLDNGGGKTDTWRYTAFGEQLARTGTSTQAFQFAGERFTASAGLYQNRARWLDVTTARFLTSDKFEGDEGLHPYLYASADAINFADPTGHFSVAQVGIAVGIGAILGAGFTAGSQFAHGEAVTVRGVLTGAAIGGGLGIVAVASPAIGAVVGVGFTALSIANLGPILVDSSVPAVRRLAAAGLIVGNVLGTGAGLRYVGRLRAQARAGEYLPAKAPKQVTPGTSTLEGVYVDDLGRVQPWRAFYDLYGRLIGRTDYNAGNKAARIPDIHHHRFIYDNKYPFGYEVQSHVPGEYVP